MYDLYKPLRNQLQQNGLAPSLYVVWAWMVHLQFGVTLPSDIQVPFDIRHANSPLRRGFYEWELALLAKELVVQAPLSDSPNFRSWNRFSTAINALKTLDNAISSRYAELLRREVLIEMYRSAHHQFHWQHPEMMFATVARYFKIFSTPPLNSILETVTGLNARTLYTIGLSAVGHFVSQFVLPVPATFSLSNVSVEQVAYFLQTYTRDLDFMRAECRAKTDFNEDFIYSENPLLQYPIIRITQDNATAMVAPIPSFLLRRFTEGVYYDIVSTQGFDNAFGDAFQGYIGEVLAARNPSGKLTIRPEHGYRVGRDRKRSIDWIASDSQGDLFIECKTKRVRRDAKVALADLGPLRSELEKLADAVVQIYKTLNDALAGAYEHWKPRGLPIFPVIVTLEDWYTFGRLGAEVDGAIREKLADIGIPLSFPDQYPYSVCSAADFERFIGIVEMRGVATVMTERFRGEQRHWLLQAVMYRRFNTEYTSTRQWLFPHALDEITG